MAVSSVLDNHLLVRTYETNEFTVNAGKIGDASFSASIAIDGYSIIGWRYVTGSNVTIRNDIVIVNLQTGKMRVYNSGSTNTTGTITVNVSYAPDRIIR